MQVKKFLGQVNISIFFGPGEYFHISIFLGPGENFQCPWSIFKKAHFQLTKEKGGGVACLLYSVVLSCGFKQYDQKFNS